MNVKRVIAKTVIVKTVQKEIVLAQSVNVANVIAVHKKLRDKVG